jgi:hypothetical protein
VISIYEKLEKIKLQKKMAEERMMLLTKRIMEISHMISQQSLKDNE